MRRDDFEQAITFEYMSRSLPSMEANRRVRGVLKGFHIWRLPSQRIYSIVAGGLLFHEQFKEPLLVAGGMREPISEHGQPTSSIIVCFQLEMPLHPFITHNVGPKNFSVPSYLRQHRLRNQYLVCPSQSALSVLTPKYLGEFRNPCPDLCAALKEGAKLDGYTETNNLTCVVRFQLDMLNQLHGNSAETLNSEVLTSAIDNAIMLYEAITRASFLHL